MSDKSKYVNRKGKRGGESMSRRPSMSRKVVLNRYHKLSTNEFHQHNKCPAGENSWCSWQRAKSTNTLQDFSHKNPLPETVFKAIKPIYKD